MVHEDPDDDETFAGQPDEAAGIADRTVLDHRILGYPGGGFVLVVLGGDGLTLEEAALAAAELGRHITTFSPGLMACSVQSVQVSVLDRPHDDENWLPPLTGDAEDTRPYFPLAEHMDDNLQTLATRYLLAGAVRSLWSPGQRVNDGSWLIAREVVLGAVEHPWGRELTSTLGSLLIKAARMEEESGEYAKLTVTAGGTVELAADLLQRTRSSVDEDSDDWDDDEDYDDGSDDSLRGHQLLEEFAEEHGLLWNRVLDGESGAGMQERGDRQLRELLWAGLNALATLSNSARSVTNPWALLAEIDDDPVIAMFARTESTRIEEALESDGENLDAAASACALAWLAARNPDVLETARGQALLAKVADDVTAFHMVANAQLMEIGPNPIRASIAELSLSDAVRRGFEVFARALDVTWADDDSGEGDYEGAYEAMSETLEALLAGDGMPLRAVREVARVFHRAAELTGTEVNPRRGVDRYISSAQELSADLLQNGAMHAALMLSQVDDEDGALRMGTLGLTAWVHPGAAGMLATELPDLVSSDPRAEPAARQRSLRWLTRALEVAEGERGGSSALRAVGDYGLSAMSHDARELLTAVADGAGRVGDDWDVRRFAGAAAEAAASVLVALDAEPEMFIAVFGGLGGAPDRGTAAEFLDS